MTALLHDRLETALHDLADGRRLALFTGRDSYEASGAQRQVGRVLGDQVAAHWTVGPLPTAAIVERIVPEFLAADPGAVLAIGGGAVMDVAKAVTLFAAQSDPTDTNPRTEWQPVQVEITAVPTTAGSGSEATPFAVMYVGDTKHSLSHPSLLPARVALDPSLLRSVPWPIAAAAGLDVIAHCIESMWSTRSTITTVDRAEATLGQAMTHLDDSRHDNDARIRMQQAAYAAGTCIAVTRTTAAHALSYHLTLHHGVAHGHAAALTLGSVLEFNAGVDPATCQDARGIDHVNAVVDRICATLGAGSPAGARRAIFELIASTGLPADLQSIGLPSEEIGAMAASANAERLATNPRTATQTDLETLIDRAWEAE